MAITPQECVCSLFFSVAGFHARCANRGRASSVQNVRTYIYYGRSTARGGCQTWTCERAFISAAPSDQRRMPHATLVLSLRSMHCN